MLLGLAVRGDSTTFVIGAIVVPVWLLTVRVFLETAVVLFRIEANTRPVAVKAVTQGHGIGLEGVGRMGRPPSCRRARPNWSRRRAGAYQGGSAGAAD